MSANRGNLEAEGERRMARFAASAGLGVYGYNDYGASADDFETRRELPHPEGVLIFNLGAPITIVGGDGGVLRLGAGQAFFAGVHLRPAFSSASGPQRGVHVYLPLQTLRRLLAVPMGEFVDQVAPLDAFLGAAADELGERLGGAPDAAARVALIDAALRRRLGEAAPLAARQASALQRLRERPDLDVGDIAREVGWSRKHFASQVEDAVGVGPRSFRRLLRFQRLRARIDGDARSPNWAGLAYDAGYCDQSHMIREFREFAGMTPTTYRARSLPGKGGLVER